MRISQTHRFVFVSTPKCCTHTMYAYLERHYAPLIVRGMHRNDIPAGLVTDDWCVWTVSRNPYSRIVSLWWTTTVRTPDDHYQIRERITGQRDGNVSLLQFLQWLPSAHDEGALWQPQHYWLRDVPITHVVPMEGLPCSLGVLPWWRGPQDLPRLNAATVDPPNPGPGPWRRHMTPRIAKLIRDWAGADFACYGYDPEDWQ